MPFGRDGSQTQPSNNLHPDFETILKVAKSVLLETLQLL